MTELKVFSSEEFGTIKTKEIDGETWFIGKEIAEKLGYERPDNAIRMHVDVEDKLMHQISASGQTRNMIMINESGLYSLILKSTLESAKRFKRWVTSDVLPEIRKKGYYQVPTNPMDALKLMFEVQEETREGLMRVESRITDLEDNATLSAAEYGYITKMINRKVKDYIELAQIKKQEAKSLLYRDINTGVNAVCKTTSRTQVRRKQFNDVVDFVSGWVPSQATLFSIKKMVVV